MNIFTVLLTSLLIFSNMVLFDFNKDSDLTDWRIVDDVVMGGRSDGQFKINKNGNAVFHGTVSLENNGGFSSVRYRFSQKDVSTYKSLMIRLKGDGKNYQFRVKSNQYDRHSYIYEFQTTGSWQLVDIPMLEMYPGFRGRKLDIPNYPCETLEEISFLISNKKTETFELVIDKIVFVSP